MLPGNRINRRVGRRTVRTLSTKSTSKRGLSTRTRVRSTFTRGNENFARVKTPQAGDLIVWPGHVGIMVDPLQHSFYSLVSTGFDAQDYQGLYWKSRGKPRFYRFKVEDSKSVTVAKAAPPARTPKSEGQRGGALVTEKHSAAEYSAANRPPKAASERTAVFHGTRPPEDADAPALTTEVPPSILIVTGKKQPTREEITEGISEYSNAAGNVLRAGDPAKLRSPVVIFERFNVERVEIKRDHGWAHLQIDSKVSVSANGAELKKRREKVRWELRRTESGWEAVPPPDRTYVPRDMAVKNLAGQLARLTQSGGARRKSGGIAETGVATRQPAQRAAESKVDAILARPVIEKSHLARPAQFQKMTKDWSPRIPVWNEARKREMEVAG